MINPILVTTFNHPSRKSDPSARPREGRYPALPPYHHAPNDKGALDTTLIKVANIAPWVIIHLASIKKEGISSRDN